MTTPIDIPESQYQKPIGSTRTFEEWKEALIKLYAHRKGVHVKDVHSMEDARIKPYYEQGMQPTVCFNELFNN